MIYKVERSLNDFTFWSGAGYTYMQLTEDEISTIEELMEECNQDWTETSINDFFWFEQDTIAEWLGYESWEDLMNNRTQEKS